MPEYIRVGKRGTVVIPAEIRRRYGLEEGEMLVMEESSQGLLFKPVSGFEIEIYTPERMAEFALNNAITAEEYDAALEAAQTAGLDIDTIPHQPRPAG